MKILGWYVGFYRARLRDAEGRITPRAWFGHVQIWGMTEDETWLFLDPVAQGCMVLVTHRHDDVIRLLEERAQECHMILRVPVTGRNFRVPVHGMMTCAAIVGHMIGYRALLPATLRRKLRAHGAEVVHEKENVGWRDRRPRRAGSA